MNGSLTNGIQTKIRLVPMTMTPKIGNGTMNRNTIRRAMAMKGIGSKMKIRRKKVSAYMGEVKFADVRVGQWFTFTSPSNPVDLIRQKVDIFGSSKSGCVAYDVVYSNKPYFANIPDTEICYLIDVTFVDGGIEWDYKKD